MFCRGQCEQAISFPTGQFGYSIRLRASFLCQGCHCTKTPVAFSPDTLSLGSPGELLPSIGRGAQDSAYHCLSSTLSWTQWRTAMQGAEQGDNVEVTVPTSFADSRSRVKHSYHEVCVLLIYPLFCDMPRCLEANILSSPSFDS